MTTPEEQADAYGEAANELIDTRFPPAETIIVHKARGLRSSRLWYSIAVALLSLSVFMALVIAWSAYQNEHGRADASGSRAGRLEHQLTVANARLARVTRLTASNAVETACRAALGNEVSDAAAATTVAIGDLAVALYDKSPPRAVAAASDYRKASLKYAAAVEQRRLKLPSCSK